MKASIYLTSLNITKGSQKATQLLVGLDYYGNMVHENEDGLDVLEYHIHWCTAVFSRRVQEPRGHSGSWRFCWQD